MALVVGIQLQGFGAASAQLRQMTAALRQLSAVQKQIGGMPGMGGGGGGANASGMPEMRALVALGRMQVSLLSQIAANGGGRGGGGGGGIAARGSLANLRQAYQDLQTAMAGGNPATIRDAQVRHRRAQMRFDRDENLMRGGPGFGSRLNTFVRSTRFGNQGLSPLVGRALDLFGGRLAAFAGPIALAAAAVTAFTKVIMDGAAGLQAASTARILSGGTAGQIASLQGMGIGADQIAAQAQALREAMVGGGLAAGMGQQLGLGIALPRGMGKTNEAEDLQKFIEGVSKMERAEDRLRAAQLLNQEAILPQIEAYRRNAKAMKADGDARAKIASMGATDAADDLGNALGRIKDNANLAAQNLSGPFLKSLTAISNATADGMRALADPKYADGANVSKAVDKAMDAMRKAKSTALLGPKTLDGSIMKAKDAALDANTKALNRVTAAFGDGAFGGGARARGALPAKYNGFAFDQAVAGTSLRMGAFVL